MWWMLAQVGPSLAARPQHSRDQKHILAASAEMPGAEAQRSDKQTRRLVGTRARAAQSPLRSRARDESTRGRRRGRRFAATTRRVPSHRPNEQASSRSKQSQQKATSRRTLFRLNSWPWAAHADLMVKVGLSSRPAGSVVCTCKRRAGAVRSEDRQLEVGQVGAFVGALDADGAPHGEWPERQGVPPVRPRASRHRKIPRRLRRACVHSFRRVGRNTRGGCKHR